MGDTAILKKGIVIINGINSIVPSSTSKSPVFIADVIGKYEVALIVHGGTDYSILNTVKETKTS